MSDHDHFIEPHTRTLHTRREFLRTSMLGAAAAWTLPVFLQKTFMTLDAQAADLAVQGATGKDGTILVVLQMAGGNDGLNTVVPWADDAYYKARPVIGIKADSVLKVNDYMGLNPKLAGLKSLYDEGHLSILQGVGYPNPNRSHFRSTEIWQTGSDADKNESYGWLGKYFDSCCKGADPTVGVAVGNQLPQSFSSPNPTGVSFSRPEQYRWVNNDKTGASEALFREFNAPSEEAADANAGGSIGMIGGTKKQSHGSALDFLQRTALDAQMSSDKVLEIARKYKAAVDYPRSPLADSLNLVARMIAGGLATRVYYVSQGGYDTHTNETATHDRLMGEFGDALGAFAKDLQAQGNFSRVMVMTFSEFGRRVTQNASNGTDHGAAAPMFVMGGGVKPGVFGKYPSLTELNAGDLVYNLDFRSVYATVLEKWLRAPSKQVLGRNFPLLPIV
ncbi:MAG: hypothetical protein QOD99_485 [Chthoniobacter sp.]|jgi:uncharacterized protein (DUF1501 family)|nr:hypothetical protein [Chthoniobacter sp.]